MLATVTIGAVLVGSARPFFAAVFVATLVSVGGFALVAFMPLTAVQAAAVVAVTSTVAGTAVPLLAFRLAGLRLAPVPPPPNTCRRIRSRAQRTPAGTCHHRRPVHDRHVRGLAVPTGYALVLVSDAPGWAPAALVVLVALVRTLAARPMTSAWHRLALVVPSTVGLVGVTLQAAAVHPPLRLLVPAALLRSAPPRSSPRPAPCRADG